MRIPIEVSTDEGSVRQRIATFERDAGVPAGEGVGLTLDEVNALVQRLQTIVVTGHVGEIVAANSSCGVCDQALPRKGSARIVYRTAFGRLDLACPRLYSQCRCGARAYASDSFNPLAMILPQRTPTPSCYTCRPAGRAACRMGGPPNSWETSCRSGRLRVPRRSRPRFDGPAGRWRPRRTTVPSTSSTRSPWPFPSRRPRPVSWPMCWRSTQAMSARWPTGAAAANLSASSPAG